MWKRKVLLLFSWLPILLWGEIKGVVMTEMDDGQLVGIPAVIVRTIDGLISTQSDVDGFFELGVSEGTQLCVESFGYQSQTFIARDFNQIVLRKKRNNGGLMFAYENNWHVIVMANGMSSLPFYPAIGLTIGMVRKGGWYLNGMTGFGFKQSDMTLKNGYDDGTNDWNSPFYTGEVSQKLWSVTGGAVAKLGKLPLYWYIGAGYGYKSIMYKTNNDKWVAFVTESSSDWSPLESVILETGCIGNIHGFAISVGYAAFVSVGHPLIGTSAAHELKIGIGGLIPCK